MTTKDVSGTGLRMMFAAGVLGLQLGCSPTLSLRDPSLIAEDRTPAGIELPGAEPAPTETSAPQQNCPAGFELAPGDEHANLACLPHLDDIEYWQVADRFRELDGVPVKIAILDGQFKTDHPDLQGAVEFTYNFNRKGCQDPDTSTDAACKDVRGQQNSNHGTLIASLIAGRGRAGSGIVGVNPSARLYLLAGSGNNYFMPALRYAVRKKVDIITMSWSLGPAPGTDDVPEFRALLKQASDQGTLIVMAAGNRALNVETTPVYPTRYSDIGGVIAVGSTQGGRRMEKFSNFGPRYVDLGAPGRIAGAGGNGTQLYSVATGTSFSGPLAAAAASRIIQWKKKRNQAYTARQIEEALLEGSVSRAELKSFFHEGRDLNLRNLWEFLSRSHP